MSTDLEWWVKNAVSPGIKAGRYLYLPIQYNKLEPEQREYFYPVVVRGETFYRWVWDQPSSNKDIKVERVLDPDDICDSMYSDFVIIVDRFITSIEESDNDLIEADEDEEFTYGALCTALACLSLSETDWLLDHVSGSLWIIRKINDIDLEDTNAT